jgi:mRNA-degrading endonuclease RelE of RelBE toxin-antitoxin system
MQDKTPLTEVIESISYQKELKKLTKKYRSIRKDVKPLIQQLADGETPGDRISGNKYPVYKVRVKNSDTRSGKSGGYRVIYYTKTPTAILLTSIYAKSDRDSISNEEVEAIIDRYELEVEQQEQELMTTELEDSSPQSI